jgi:hypothetical protein
MRRWLRSILFFAFALHAECPPDLISIASGVFDVMREKHRSFEVEMEYKFHLSCLKAPHRMFQFRPLIGLMATARGSIYGYLGINFDLLFADHIHFAPGFAAGYFTPGDGKNLGYPLEFRSGIELAWQFDDWHRLGVHFYHLSNASIGHRNPGEESFVLFYDIPLIKGFPFIRDN